MTAFDASNQSVAVYIKFDEFLVRWGENESDDVVLSRFRSRLTKILDASSLCETSPL